MNKPRVGHGLLKINQKIFAFGTTGFYEIRKCAEVYDVAQNSWKNLPDMPENCRYVSCVRV